MGGGQLCQISVCLDQQRCIMGKGRERKPPTPSPTHLKRAKVKSAEELRVDPDFVYAIGAERKAAAEIEILGCRASVGSEGAV